MCVLLLVSIIANIISCLPVKTYEHFIVFSVFFIFCSSLSLILDPEAEVQNFIQCSNATGANGFRLYLGVEDLVSHERNCPHSGVSTLGARGGTALSDPDGAVVQKAQYIFAATFILLI